MDQFTQVLVAGLSQGSIYALLGLGFCIVSMSTRVLNIAQGAYALIGGFLFVTLAAKLKLPLAGAFALSVIAAGLMGAVTERIVNFSAKPWKPVLVSLPQSTLSPVRVQVLLLPFGLVPPGDVVDVEPPLALPLVVPEDVGGAVGLVGSVVGSPVGSVLWADAAAGKAQRATKLRRSVSRRITHDPTSGAHPDAIRGPP